jgi:uncharacterized membrane protein (DUF2068 family)
MLVSVPARRPAKQASDLWIVVIGIFKLMKAAGLLIVGIGLLKLVHRDVAAVTTHWVERFRLDPDNQHIHAVLARIFRVTPKQLRELSVGTFVYASIFLTEGTGLLMRKHWAEYLTLISTGLFIPLEVYELAHRFTPIRLVVLLLNFATVWYLAVRIRRRRA